MNFKLLVFTTVIIIIGCTKQPEIIPDEVVDLTYNELKTNFGSCSGKGIMSSKGKQPWKLNYTFTTQNDSSFIQFRDIFGRRMLFVQALPFEVKFWDMQKNLQYDNNKDTMLPILDLVGSYDIAQILWGEIPKSYSENNLESGFERDSNLVNFTLTASKLGMVLDKVTFNIDSVDTIIEFKIFDRNYGDMNLELLRGIPEHIPYN